MDLKQQREVFVAGARVYLTTDVVRRYRNDDQPVPRYEKGRVGIVMQPYDDHALVRCDDAGDDVIVRFDEMWPEGVPYEAPAPPQAPEPEPAPDEPAPA